MSRNEFRVATGQPMAGDPEHGHPGVLLWDHATPDGPVTTHPGPDFAPAGEARPEAGT